MTHAPLYVLLLVTGAATIVFGVPFLLGLVAVIDRIASRKEPAK